MVTDLWKVMRWCKEKGIHEFKKKDIEHLLSKSVQANFAYWRWFGGLAYSPDDISGHYGLNIERCKKFFAGELEIAVQLLKNPLTGELRQVKTGKIRDVPNLQGFLDENSNYIASYRTPQDPEQMSIL
jgi:hypothetical protein